MENVIIAHGLEGYIDGTNKCPMKFLDQQSSINPLFTLWMHQDRMLLSWIYSSLTKNIMMQIVGHKTSYDSWTTLESLYASTNHACIMQLKLELYSSQKGSKKISEFLLHIKKIVDNLNAINETISEKDHVMYILGGLGSDYLSFVVSITSCVQPVKLE